MSSLMATLGVDRLSVDDKLRLVEEICDSLDAETPPPRLSAAQIAELDRRIAAWKADPGSLRPWAEVEARILAKLKK